MTCLDKFDLLVKIKLLFYLRIGTIFTVAIFILINDKKISKAAIKLLLII
jgi:hypothetical protein